MFSLIPSLYAATPQGDQASGMMQQFALFGTVFLIFYLFVIRPQQKKQKEHKKLLANLNKGDKVVTLSGIHGSVNKVFDDQECVLLEIADKTVIKIDKQQISHLA